MTGAAVAVGSDGSAAPLRVAVWQCHPVPRDVRANLARLDAVLAEAVAGGAGLLVTPELVLTGYAVGALTGLLGYEPVAQLCELARLHGVAVVAGVALSGDGCTWNAAVTIDRDGNHLSTYRKAHLFGDLDRSRFACGAEPFALVDIDGVKVATMICYDVEFPEPVRAAALAGADLLAVPTANMHPYGVVSDLVVPVRAWENQVHVAYANHCGREGSVDYVGRSVVVGPDGRDLARAGLGEEVLFADIDPGVVRTAHQMNPYLTDRRPELYPSLVQTRSDPDGRP